MFWFWGYFIIYFYVFVIEGLCGVVLSMDVLMFMNMSVIVVL